MTVEEIAKAFWDGWYGESGYTHPIPFADDEGTPVNHGIHAIQALLVERIKETQ